jgi:uncharacterized protein (DUF3084 family)
MRIFSTLLKYAVVTCLMILISSSVYGQSETQKMDILKLQEEISKNQNNPSYDKEAARLKLDQMVVEYNKQSNNNVSVTHPKNEQDANLESQLEPLNIEYQKLNAEKIALMNKGKSTEAIDEKLNQLNKKIELKKRNLK